MNIRKIAAWVLLCMLLLPFSAALGAQQRVYDQARLFTPSERESLEAAIAEFQRQTGMDFVIHTSSQPHNDTSTEAVADDFYDAGGFGLDEEHSGVIYFIDMYERIQHLGTTGAMIDYLTDARIQDAIDACTNDLTSRAYAAAAETMLGKVRSSIRQGIPDGQYRYDVVTGQRLTSRHRALTPMDLLIGAIAAVITGILCFVVVTRRYQLKSSTYRYEYIANTDLKLEVVNDTFLRTSTSVIQKPPPSSGDGGFGGGGGGGGSGVHVGSSGTSHGGGGGRF